MKRKILTYALVVVIAASMTACKNDYPTDYVDTTVTTEDTIADTTSDTTATEETIAGYIDEIIKNLPADANIDGLTFHEANGGKLILVNNKVNAWAYDYESGTLTPIVYYYDMLTAADIGQRSGDWFEGETALSLALVSESENGVGIEFTVTTADEQAEYTVYAFYSFDGGLGEYHYRSLTFPESGKGVSITNFADFKKLATTEDNSLFRFAKAIVENDVPTLEELCCVDAGVLASWEGMEISDYSLTRVEFGEFLEELYLRVNVTKSDVAKLPVGNNVLVIREGMMTCDVEFVTTDGSTEKTFESAALDWIKPWITTYGYYDPQWVVLNPEEYLHAMLDFFMGKYEGNVSDSSAAEFAEFCEKHFRFPPVTVDDDYVTNHGGHGLQFRYHKITNVSDYNGYCIVTVDYFADPMGTVVAYTHEFTVIENDDGSFRLNKTERTYDSGLKSYGFSN